MRKLNLPKISLYTVSAYTIDCIQDGYKLPLYSEPPPHEQSNSASAFKYNDFVTEAVAKLLHNGCIKKLESAPHTVYVARGQPGGEETTCDQFALLKPVFEKGNI